MPLPYARKKKSLLKLSNYLVEIREKVLYNEYKRILGVKNKLSMFFRIDTQMKEGGMKID